MKPLISIIIPVYNSAEYLNKCIDSVIYQTYENIEIICINDASSDNSLEILKNYQKKDKRIKIIDKENEGVSIARNSGLSVATGDFIMFVDADDWIDECTCEEAIKIQIEENADVVMWSYIREFNNSSLPKKIFSQDKTIVFYEKDVKQKLHRRFIGLIGDEMENPQAADSLCPVWGKIYRRDIIVDNQLEFYDIREIGTYEDGLFNLNVFNYVKKAVYINEFYYHYRKTNTASVTTMYNERLEMQWKKLFELMRLYIDCNNLDEIYTEALNNRIAMSIFGLGLNIVSANESEFDKIKHIKNFLKDDNYRNACRGLKLKYFPIHWRLFYGSAKINISIPVYLMLRCMQMIRKKMA